ncbi:hypothetical protein JCM19239_7366 [Vibrio variabilis]|uniref:Uncharacterized protein n=1 Tax=Vibrio variabilis TaxID=990271 RepID=A0ABQ0J7M4_9VIBR|nr:hypothetical protein JCM19239_7366 [Vibrio variabilis]
MSHQPTMTRLLVLRPRNQYLSNNSQMPLPEFPGLASQNQGLPDSVGFAMIL